MSMQSILTWPKNGYVLDSQSRYLWSQIIAKGNKKSKPINSPQEVPILITELIMECIKVLHYTNDEIASILCLNTNDFE